MRIILLGLLVMLAGCATAPKMFYLEPEMDITVWTARDKDLEVHFHKDNSICIKSTDIKDGEYIIIK